MQFIHVCEICIKAIIFLIQFLIENKKIKTIDQRYLQKLNENILLTQFSNNVDETQSINIFLQLSVLLSQFYSKILLKPSINSKAESIHIN